MTQASAALLAALQQMESTSSAHGTRVRDTVRFVSGTRRADAEQTCPRSEVAHGAPLAAHVVAPVQEALGVHDRNASLEYRGPQRHREHS